MALHGLVHAAGRVLRRLGRCSVRQDQTTTASLLQGHTVVPNVGCEGHRGEHLGVAAGNHVDMAGGLGAVLQREAQRRRLCAPAEVGRERQVVSRETGEVAHLDARDTDDTVKNVEVRVVECRLEEPADAGELLDASHRVTPMRQERGFARCDIGDELPPGPALKPNAKGARC